MSDVSLDDFAAAHAAGAAQVVDVREPAEYVGGHVLMRPLFRWASCRTGWPRSTDRSRGS